MTEKSDKIYLNSWNEHLTEELLFLGYSNVNDPKDIIHTKDKLGLFVQLKLPSEFCVNELKSHIKGVKQQAVKKEIIICPSLQVESQTGEANQLNDLKIVFRQEDEGYYSRTYSLSA